MKTNNNHIDIRTIELYLRGKLTAEQKTAIDELRSSDPFLDAALSGYEQVPESINGYKSFNKRYKKGGYFYWYTGFALLALLGSLFYLTQQTESSLSVVPIRVNTTGHSSSPQQSVLPNKPQELSKQIPAVQQNQTFNTQKKYTDSLSSNSISIQTPIKEDSAVLFAPADTQEELKESISQEVSENNIALTKPASQLDVTVYYLYTREYILNTYLAMNGGSKKSYTQKGRDELDLLKSYLKRGQLKKALALLNYKGNGVYTKENNSAMIEWINALDLVEKKEYEAAYLLLKNIETLFPLRMQPTVNKLRSELAD